MHIGLLDKLFALLWWGAVLVGTAALAFSVVAPVAGQPLLMEIPYAETAEATQGTAGPEAPQVTWFPTGGVLQYEGNAPVPVLLRIASIAGLLTVALYTIAALRMFLRQIGQGRPFDGTVGSRLTRAGVLLTVYPLYTFAISMAWQIYLLGMDESISRSFTTLLAARPGRGVLLPDFDPLPILAGIVLVMIGWASSQGAELQRDSDEVV